MVILLQINKIAFEKSENLEENHISQNLVFLNFFLKWYLKILKKNRGNCITKPRLH